MNIRCFHRHFPPSSHPLRPLPLPSTVEAHLWYAIPDEVKNFSLLNEYFDILSPCEKENVLSLRKDQLRKRAILARALVRTTIARYQNSSQVDPKSLKFKKNIHGKPEVEWQHAGDWSQPLLHFNISHTSSLIACGVAVNSPIGIDVEEKQRMTKNNVLSFARRFFCLREVEYLADISDPEDQRQEFIKLWTLKEAYVKALGRGFSAAPFKTFTIHFKSNFHLPGDSNYSEVPEIVVETIDDSMNLTSHWQFALLELAGTHYASICMEKNDTLEDKEGSWINLRVWRTIPLLEDECVSQTSSVITVGGLVKQLNSG
ncbi:hypothetical protein Ancab_014298 [Ancistrocladus abbreviatus]